MLATPPQGQAGRGTGSGGVEEMGLRKLLTLGQVARGPRHHSKVVDNLADAFPGKFNPIGVREV